jgi:hypothetical protein
MNQSYAWFKYVDSKNDGFDLMKLDGHSTDRNSTEELVGLVAGCKGKLKMEENQRKVNYCRSFNQKPMHKFNV